MIILNVQDEISEMLHFFFCDLCKEAKHDFLVYRARELEVTSGVTESSAVNSAQCTHLIIFFTCSQTGFVGLFLLV